MPAEPPDHSAAKHPAEKGPSLVRRAIHHGAALLVRYRLFVLAGLTGLTLLAGLAATQIQFDFSPQTLFTGGDNLVVYSEDLKEDFGHEDAVLLVLLTATGKQDALAGPLLDWQREIGPQLARLRDIDRVDSLPTLQLPRIVLRRPGYVIGPLVWRHPVDSEEEERIRAVIDHYPMLEGTFVSRDRRLATMLVLLDPDARGIERMTPVIEEVEELLASHPPPEGYRWALSGLPALRVEIVRNLARDQMTLIPYAVVCLLAILLLLFRRVSGTLLPVLAVLAAVTWTVGILAWIEMPFNIISNILPVLLLIIGVSNSVHVVSRYAEESNRRGNDRNSAVVRTISHMAIACLLTCLTTAIGFLSLMTARGATLRAFGWQAALGMGLLYITILAILGAGLPMLRPPRFGGQVLVPRLLARLGIGVARHAWLTLLGGGLLVVVAIYYASGVHINSHMIETFDDDHPTIATIQQIEDQLAGFASIEISLSANDPDRLLTPDVFRRVEEVTQFAADDPDVVFARSYVDLFADINRNTRRGRSGESLWSDGDEQAALRIERARGILEEFPDQLGYTAFLRPDRQRGRIVLRVRDIGTSQALVLIEQLERKLAELFPPQVGVAAKLTGDVYVNALAIDGFIRDMYYSLIAASLGIFAVIAMLFRSIRVGLVAALPNLTPLVLTLGYMGWRGYDMNAGNVVVFAVSLGVAVDDTIHFLTRFYDELKRDGDVPKAIHRTFRSTGRAMLLTSLLIIGGLLVLHSSSFVPTRRFAELTSVTILSALLGDLLLLPACLVLFSGRTNTQSPQPATTTITP